ncbi:MAG: YceI family protein [Gemmatimonadetes bacterium]|nr:YceI family protein [Gemmatimonadota bacterium]
MKRFLLQARKVTMSAATGGAIVAAMAVVAALAIAGSGVISTPAFAQDAGGGVAASDTAESAPPAAEPAVQDAPAQTAPVTPVVYSTPGDVPLPPEKFAGMRRALVFNHFPNPVSASTDPDQPGFNFWKHNTAIMSETDDVTLEEAGSYIYYNDQWNLRVTFTPEEFAGMFACPNALMKAGQPYTWADNWRTDERLYGGWACYYAIGVTASGERVYGTGPLETTGFYYFGEDEWVVNVDSSSAGWTGRAKVTSFSIDGTIAIVSGSAVVKGTDVLRGEIIFDMASIASETDGVSQHLMSADFFEAATFPYAVFKMTDPVLLGEDGGVARGELTMKGVTKPIDVSFSRLAMEDGESAAGGSAGRMLASGETTFNRTDFGVNYGSTRFFPDLRDQAIADEVQLRFDLVLERE